MTVPSRLASCSTTLSCASMTATTTCARLDGLQGLDDAEFLDRLLDARAAPHARRVDQRVALAVALEGHHDGIARGPRLIECHHAILAEQAVDQRALADIRAADDRDLDAGRLGPVLGIRARVPRAPPRARTRRPDRARRRWGAARRARAGETPRRPISGSNPSVLLTASQRRFAAAPRELRRRTGPAA